MATVTGNLADFRPMPLGVGAQLVFRPDGTATTRGTLLATKEIRVGPDASGAFSVELTPTEATNPTTPYRVRIEWFDAGGNFVNVDEVPWALVVPYGGGSISELFADVAAGKLITKGDKGDPGNMVQQAAIDALTAKDHTHDRQITELQRGVLANSATLTEQRRLIDRNAKIAHDYTDARTQGVLDVMDTSNVDLDMDGVPFIHFGSMTVAVLQDTDGNPYYKPRS